MNLYVVLGMKTDYKVTLFILNNTFFRKKNHKSVLPVPGWKISNLEKAHLKI